MTAEASPSLFAWIARHAATIEPVERPESDGYCWHGWRVMVPEPYALAEADDLGTALAAAAQCAGVEPPVGAVGEEW